MDPIPQEELTQWGVYYYDYLKFESLIITMGKPKAEAQEKLMKEISTKFNIEMGNNFEEFKFKVSNDKEFSAYKKNDQTITVYQNYWTSSAPIASFSLISSIIPLIQESFIPMEQKVTIFEQSEKNTTPEEPQNTEQGESIKFFEQIQNTPHCKDIRNIDISIVQKSGQEEFVERVIKVGVPEQIQGTITLEKVQGIKTPERIRKVITIRPPRKVITPEPSRKSLKEKKGRKKKNKKKNKNKKEQEEQYLETEEGGYILDDFEESLLDMTGKYFPQSLDKVIGLSSKTIFSFFALDDQLGLDYPVDICDFARNFALLSAYPNWRARIGELKVLGERWESLVEDWDTIEETYLKEKKMYDDMEITYNQAICGETTDIIQECIAIYMG